MKTMNLYFLSICFFGPLFIYAQNTAPEVTNVRFEQRTDGTNIVDIYYDVTDNQQSSVTVSVKVSNDAGATWDFAAISLTEDIGEDIAIGINKHIVWEFAADHPEYYSDQIQIKVLADDLIKGIPCPEILKVYYDGGPNSDEGGEFYNTVQIGDQCWFKENLNIGILRSGQGGNKEQKDNGIIEKFCYDDKIENCITHGGMYKWDEAMQYSTDEGLQGICPDGWHIPTKDELETLKIFAQNDANRIKKIAQGIHGNSTGFSALMSGYHNGWYWHFGIYGYFFSSTKSSEYDSYALYVSEGGNTIAIGSVSSGLCVSVRCIKD